MSKKEDQLIPVSPLDVAMVTWMHGFSPYGVITTDRDFRVQSWNHWMEVHAGQESSAVVGKKLFELYPELADRSLLPRFHRALEGEVSVLSTALHGYLFRWPAAPGHHSFQQMRQTARIAPLHHGADIVGAIIVIEDVTEREAQAHTLRCQHQRDAILAWALGHLLESQTPVKSIRDLFFKVVEQFDFDAYLLYLFEPGGKTLKLRAAGGVLPDEEARLAALPVDAEAGAIFVKADVPTALENLHQSTLPEAVLSGKFGFRACAMVPLSAGQGRLGTLCFATRTRDHLEEGEMELLSTIGQYVAVALSKESINTELRSAEEKVNRYAQDLEKQVDNRTAQLRETISELEAYSYSISHDLRAPIRAMAGYCDVLTEDYAEVLPTDAKDIIGRLSSSCVRLDDLARDLLEFARISRQEIQLTAVNVDTLIAEILKTGILPAAQVTVQRPLWPVRAQATLLQQCLANLIDNAAKFVESGVVPRLTIRTERVPVKEGETETGSTPVPPRVRIVVEDNGIGIEPEAFGKIFGIFERATSSSTYPGSGMGLAIVARAIQRMSGTCGGESKVGVGSRFWLELPAA